MKILDIVKKSIGRDYTDTLDDMISLQISAAFEDLRMAGVIDANDQTTSAAVIQAVSTYVACHFAETDEYDHLKAFYDEQKAQLMSSSEHTDYEMYGIKTWADKHGDCGCGCGGL